MKTQKYKLFPFLLALLLCMVSFSAPALAYVEEDINGAADSEREETTTDSGAVETKQVGTVANTNGAPLNVRTGPGMAYAVFDQLQPGETVEVIEEEHGWYKVTVSGQTGYAGKQYLTVTAESVDEPDDRSLDLDADVLEALAQLFTQGLTVGDSPDAALTPEGNLTLVDDLGSVSGPDKQFMTVSTKSGNYFYLIIDRDDEGENTVHFLNQVDERDLLTLMDEEEAAAYEETATEEVEPVTEEPVPEEEEEPAEDVETPEEPEASEKTSTLLPVIVLLLALIGGGVFLYQRMKLNRQAAQERPDPDADYLEDQEDVLDLPEEESDETDADEDDGYPDEEPL